MRLETACPRAPRGASDIVVTGVRVVPAAFDARFSALDRRYTYRIADAESPRDPLRRGHVLWMAERLDVDAMAASAAPPARRARLPVLLQAARRCDDHPHAAPPGLAAGGRWSSGRGRRSRGARGGGRRVLPFHGALVGRGRARCRARAQARRLAPANCSRRGPGMTRPLWLRPMGSPWRTSSTRRMINSPPRPSALESCGASPAESGRSAPR